MDDLISRRWAIEAIENIRQLIWDVDIPSPTVPEYVEHHEQMQMLMHKCDVWLSIIEGAPAAQPENKELSAWKEDFRGYIRMLNLPRDDYKGIMACINEVPPAQPIIHCGTCKWFQCNMRQDGYLPKGVDEFECRHWCGPCDPVDFCSRAERREE